MNGQFPHKDFCLPFAIKRRCFSCSGARFCSGKKVGNCVKTKIESIQLESNVIWIGIWHGILGRSKESYTRHFTLSMFWNWGKSLFNLGGVFPNLMIPAPAWPGTHRAVNDVFSATFEMWKWVEDAPQTELFLVWKSCGVSDGVETSILSISKFHFQVSWLLQFSPEIIPEIDFRVY